MGEEKAHEELASSQVCIISAEYDVTDTFLDPEKKARAAVSLLLGEGERVEEPFGS